MTDQRPTLRDLAIGELDKIAPAEEKSDEYRIGYADAVFDARVAVVDSLDGGHPQSDWTEELDLSNAVRELIRSTPVLLSLLYDLDLLPEQLASQPVQTPGLVKAYHRLYGVLYAYQVLLKTLPRAEAARWRADAFEASAAIVRRYLSGDDAPMADLITADILALVPLPREAAPDWTSPDQPVTIPLGILDGAARALVGAGFLDYPHADQELVAGVLSQCGGAGSALVEAMIGAGVPGADDRGESTGG